MRPLRTTLQSIGRFKSLTLDLRDIPNTALLIAYDGAPGAGKSTLFRALTWGSLFRKFKNSGSLKDLSSGPDTSLETVVSYGGKNYTIKHLVDGKQGASQLTCEGESAHDRAKRKDFKKAVEDTFPPELLLSNTVWRDQKSLGFLELEQSERRELILLATGATQWQKWFTEANAKRIEANNAFVAACSSIAALGTTYDTEEYARRTEKLNALSGAQILVNERLAIAQRALEQKQASVLAWERANDAYKAWEKSNLECQGRINQIENKLCNIVGQQMRLKEVTENADLIRKACTETETLLVDSRKLEADVQQLKFDINLLNSRRAECSRQIGLLDNLERDISLAENDVAVSLQRGHRVDELNTVIAVKEQAISINQSAMDSAKARLLEGSNCRISKLRSRLGIIRDSYSLEDVHFCAREALEDDDRSATEKFSLPIAIEQLSRQIASTKLELDSDRRELIKCERIAADLTNAETKLRSLTASRDKLTQLQDDMRNIERELDERETYRVNVASKLVALETRLLELRPLSEQRDALATTLATGAALQIEADDLRARLDAERKQKVDAPAEPGEKPGVQSEIGVRDLASKDQQLAASTLSVFKERIRIMEETHERIEQYEAAKAEAAREEADWRKLANLISRDGIQGALVDAAGPELSKTVNYFLHTCFGNRWSQTISTQRESSDGKKTIEQCKVWVVDQGSPDDNAPPREGEGITFSGGEQEILSLAFQLALTYLARNSGIVEPDIYLDEPASSLNESMREKWVHMLRVAAGLIGCKHIHFISHNEDVKRLADARVKIERGTATIVQGDNDGQ